ncbi:MAG: M15 family metallopeptidase [Akkermansiaceae bacterium]|nr:M15 family metallopeptidase [Akkermansiaceae bacterium]
MTSMTLPLRIFGLSLVLPALAHCSGGGPEREAPAAMPAGFTYVDEVVPGVRTDLKYSGSDNFVGRPLAGYRGRRAILRTEAAQALRAAAEEFARHGCGLVIYDAYRPHTAMRDIAAWGRDSSDRKMRTRFYPRISKKQIFEHGYTHDISEHSRGVAVDVGLFDLKTGRDLDMGGHHDLLDPVSATDSGAVSPAQRKNRHLLRQVMEAHGFRNYSAEWWHYLLRDEPDKTLYFLFPVRDDMR